MCLIKTLLALILVIKLLPFCLVYSIMLVRYPRRYLLAGEKTADLLLSFEDRLFAKIRKTWRRKKMKTVTIYTDGACSGNPGPGGWGAILIYGTHKRELSGGEPDTTNNRMELTAVIQALSLLKEPCAVDLWSDSKYVIDGLEKGWARGWRARGWVKSDKKPALNPDLWETLLDLCQVHQVRTHWVKGHAENPYNNRCDQLAVGEWRKLKEE